MIRAALFATLTLMVMDSTSAADMRSVDVDYKDGFYTMESTVWFDASVDQVFEVFRQWDLSTEFSSAIVEARDELSLRMSGPEVEVAVVVDVGRELVEEPRLAP